MQLQFPPMYKEGCTVEYPSTEKRVIELQAEGYSAHFIQQDWPRIAYNANGQTVLVDSSEEAESRGLSFDKPATASEPVMPMSPEDQLAALEARVAALESLPMIAKALAKAKEAE
jgi:hypothetical protein